MDIMLADPGVDFSGGELVTPESDGTLSTPEFKQGDAVLFVSHKYHNVQPVMAGKRHVLVVEIWEGPEKTCAHRCLTAGECNYTLHRSQAAGYGGNVGILG